MRIEKERNNIYIYREDGRRYRLDIDTGIMYSLADAPMASVPKILQKNAIYVILHSNDYSPAVKLALRLYIEKQQRNIKLAEELLSVILNRYPNFTHYEFIITLMGQNDNRYNSHKLTAKTLSDCLKWANENDYQFIHNDGYYMFAKGGLRYYLYSIYTEWRRTEGNAVAYKTFGITITEEFTTEMADHLIKYLDNVAVLKALPAEKKKKYAQWFKSIYNKGYWNMYTYAKNQNSSAFLSRMIPDIVTAHEEMQIDLEKTNNFYRYYGEVMKSYTLWKEHHADERFQSKYTAWVEVEKLETENCCIVLPKSKKDLVTEGQRQHNCVGNYADYILNGDTIVLFVRKKNDKETNYITCDFVYRESAQAWVLSQYLEASNRTSNEYDMRTALINWVNANINKV